MQRDSSGFLKPYFHFFKQFFFKVFVLENKSRILPSEFEPIKN
jgi:hypothetical protein